MAPSSGWKALRQHASKHYIRVFPETEIKLMVIIIIKKQTNTKASRNK